MKKARAFAFTLLVAAALAAGCSAPPAETGPTRTPVVVTLEAHPPETRTGDAGVDGVIEAVLSGDVNEVLALAHFIAVQCTTADGLGGPPKCRAGEEVGTRVSVLPFLGPEGYFLHEEESGAWVGLDVAGLFAVYRLSSFAFSDDYYPAGETAAAFVQGNGAGLVTVQIEAGRIRRIDFIFRDFVASTLSREAEEYLLAPPNS